MAIIIICTHYEGTGSSENSVRIPDYMVSYWFLCITESIFKNKFYTENISSVSPIYSICVGVNQLVSFLRPYLNNEHKERKSFNRDTVVERL